MNTSGAVDLTQSHVFVDGQLVSAKIQRIVEAIRDYEPELDVQWIPPGARTEGQAAFAIIHRPVGHPSYVLFYVKSEEEFDERVLAKIIYNDQRNGKTATMSDLEAWEETQKRIQKQEYLDKMEEANDIAAFVAKTHLNRIRINKDLVIHDHGDNVSKIR